MSSIYSAIEAKGLLFIKNLRISEFPAHHYELIRIRDYKQQSCFHSGILLTHVDGRILSFSNS